MSETTRCHECGQTVEVEEDGFLLPHKRTKVGDCLFEFNENHRVYKTDANGANRVVYRKHFLQHWIIGEEGRSWVVVSSPPGERQWGKEKIGKSSVGKGKWFTADQMEDKVWAREHRYAVTRLLEHADVPTLRRIADALGYVPNTES